MDIVFAIILTACIYLLVPLICLAINQGKYTKKKAHRIALWNSIIIGFIMMVVTIEMEMNWTPYTAVVYYWINRAILAKKHEDTPNVVQIRYCVYCGNVMSVNDKFCTRCGQPVNQ